MENTDQNKDDIGKFAKLRLDSHGEENTVTGSKTVKEHGLASKIPGDLYMYIQQQLALWKHLKTNNDDEASKMELRCLESKIAASSRYHKHIEDLPSDWKYNLDITSNLVARKIPTPFKRALPKKKKIGPRSLPKIYNVQLNKEEQKTWEKFRELDGAVPALREISYLNDDESKTPVKNDHIIINFIGEFAVDACNKSCQMYVSKDKDKNLSEAKFMMCKYHKMTTVYYFYMTIMAIEKGNLGVYETTVECKPDDSARTPCKFVLTGRKPFGASKRAKVIDRLNSPYDTWKMVRLILKTMRLAGCCTGRPMVVMNTVTHVALTELGDTDDHGEE